MRMLALALACLLILSGCGSRVHPPSTASGTTDAATNQSRSETIANDPTAPGPEPNATSASPAASQVAPRANSNTTTRSPIDTPDGYVTWEQAKTWWPHGGLLRWKNPKLTESVYIWTVTKDRKGDPSKELAGVHVSYASKMAQAYADPNHEMRESGGYLLDQIFAPTGKDGNFTIFHEFDDPVVVRGQNGFASEASDGHGHRMRMIQWEKRLSGQAELQYILWTSDSVTLEQGIAFANALEESR